MKNYLLLISLFTALSASIFTSCQSNGARAHNSTDVLCNPQMIFPEDHGQKQKHSLVFIDLTDSSIYGEKAKSYLQKIMEQRLSTSEDHRAESKQKADKLQIFYITANTATTQTLSAANMDLQTTPLGNLVEGQTIINSSKKRRYTCELQDFIQGHLEVVDEKVHQAQSQNSDINSDVLGMFYLAEREFKRSSAEDKAIFVISDMEQFCQNGGYFQCKDTRICSSGCSSSYAQGDAAADVASIKGKLGKSLAMQGAGFHYMRGDRAIGNTNEGVLNFIQDYWAGVSQQLGLKAYDKIH
ncbi:MAG: hypothetical protein AAF696_24025 [Bacteroidota bacterium]